MRITERDRNLLMELSRCRVLRVKQAQVFYGNTRRYYLRRIEQLCREELLVRSNGFIQLGTKGCFITGTKKTKVDKSRWSAIAETFEVKNKLIGWKFYYGYEIKKEKGLDERYIFNAVIEWGNKQYLLYLLTEDEQASYIARITKELQEIRGIGYNRAVILCATKQIAGYIYQRARELIKLKELLLLPYPQGIDLLNAHNSDKVEKLIKDKFPGAKKGGNRIHVDYQWQDRDICVLFSNDLIRRVALDTYLLSEAFKIEQRKVVIVCTQSQSLLYRKKYPQAELAILSDTIDRFTDQ